MITVKENESIRIKVGEIELSIAHNPGSEVEIIPQDIVKAELEVMSDSSCYVTMTPVEHE